jgi:hypothetical protein
MRGLAALALLLIAAPAFAMARKPRVDKSMETEGQYCKIDQPCHRVIQTPEQWAALWKDLGRPAPLADFSAKFAVAAFAGTRNSGGYKVVFDKPVVENGALVIRYSVQRPKGMATMSLTQPYAIELFPKSDKPVKVEGRES